MCSNIPSGPAYGVYISQLVRIGRICDNYSAFVNRNMIITTRLIKQGYQYTKLCKCMKKFSRKHKLIFNKYGKCLKRHIQDGICLPVCSLPQLSKHFTIRKPPRLCH